jgi:hypothetical protein
MGGRTGIQCGGIMPKTQLAGAGPQICAENPAIIAQCNQVLSYAKETEPTIASNCAPASEWNLKY